jgi:hypothetical protein
MAFVAGHAPAQTVNRAAELPAGRLKEVLSKMPDALRERVIDRMEALEIPAEDYTSLRVHPRGELYYVCDHSGAPHASPAAFALVAQTTDADDPFTHAVSIASPPVFHSRPGAANVLFLDFNGHVVTNTAWNSDPEWNVASWDCRPYALDGDDATFSVAEQEAIRTIWKRVAEDYAPFDVDVTTEQPVVWTRYTGHVLITPGKDKNGVSCPHDGYGGIAFVDVFGEPFYSYDYGGAAYSPAWVLNYENPGGVEYEAEAASHEMGHNLALSHDGKQNEAYYEGHENGQISWGPIMGTGYDRNVSQWSKGDYRQANNTEDDLAIIASQLFYRPDLVGDDPLSAVPLGMNGAGSIWQVGVVEQTLDRDVFSFTTSSGLVELAVSPFLDEESATWGGNADLVLELYDADGLLVATNNPAQAAGAEISLVLESGTYYLAVRSTGAGDPFGAPQPSGYTRYGSIGQYTLSGQVPVDADADDDGLPDEWEIDYFMSPTNTLPGADPDGDGLDNYGEFIAGTNPTNPASSFTATLSPAASNGAVPVVLSWQPVTGRVYGVQWSDGLLFTPFTNISGELAYPTGAFTDTVERIDEQQFYRLEVKLAE